ncbi:MAG: hypothetical protein K2X53_00230, partial [Alphaproteobacteria bacterium]|nr:hypothetical protein [Alphaproteobacteria bacterium]
SKILFEKASDILKSAREAEESILDHNKDPSGIVKIVGTHGFINNWLLPHMPEFLDINPKLRLLLHGSTDLTLSNSDADVCIASFGVEGPEFLKEYLWSIRYKIYASKRYLSKFGTPQTPEDLDNHRLMIYSTNTGMGVRYDNWLLDYGNTQQEEQRLPYLYINSTDGMLNAIKLGLGIGAVVNDYIRINDPEIVELFPDTGYRDIDIYYWYRSHMKHSRRVTALLEFLKQKVSGPTELEAMRE